MDQISRIRFKHVLDRMLTFCDNAESEEEKAVLLRISIVVLNKLRIHANIDMMLGYEVRDLNVQVSSCTDRKQLVALMWDEAQALLQAYRDSFA